MTDLDRFTETIEIAGEECRYDPERETALIYCEKCSTRKKWKWFSKAGRVWYTGSCAPSAGISTNHANNGTARRRSFHERQEV